MVKNVWVNREQNMRDSLMKKKRDFSKSRRRKQMKKTMSGGCKAHFRTFSGPINIGINKLEQSMEN